MQLRMSEIQVWISDGSLAEIETSAVVSLPNETGGLLLGYWSDKQTVVISRITLGGPKAQHWPNRYIPDYDYDAKISEREFRNSGNIVAYLGDWHTHPWYQKALPKLLGSPHAEIGELNLLRLASPLLFPWYAQSDATSLSRGYGPINRTVICAVFLKDPSPVLFGSTNRTTASSQCRTPTPSAAGCPCCRGG